MLVILLTAITRSHVAMQTARRPHFALTPFHLRFLLEISLNDQAGERTRKPYVYVRASGLLLVSTLSLLKFKARVSLHYQLGAECAKVGLAE